MKKIIAMILSLAMILALAVSASAATITIDKGAENSEYAAYKLLNVTTSDTADENGKHTKFAYTINEKYADILAEVTGEETEADIIDHISKLDTDKIREFADAVYAAIKATQAEDYEGTELIPDATTKTDKFEDVGQGYYLIAETKTGNDQDTYSLVMLDTAGKDEITVDTKEDTPTLEKKVQEKDDSAGTSSDWQDGADYDIGDDVPYKLTGTVSDKYDSYKTYYYAFHDKLSTGLTFNKDRVVVKIDGKVVSSDNYTIVTTDAEGNALKDGCSFEVIINDLKIVVAADNTKATATSEITVEFTATLNENANIGSAGNPNEAHLEYNNNPYYDGDGKPDETGKTPDDKVIVFTYKLIANKVDEEGEALKGAGFTLYKKYIVEGVDGASDTEEWRVVGTGTVDEDKGNVFTFTGLDAGEYKLVETTVPAGYNKGDDIYFTIEADYDTNSADPKLNELVVKDKDGNVISTGEDAVFSTDITGGSVSTDVENRSGIELPSTGGIGTTLFYVIGGALMVGAVVLLVTKKRMNEKQ